MFMREGTPEKDILLLHPIEDCFRDIDIRNRVNPDSHTEWAARERGFNKLLCDLLGGHWQFDLGDEETLSSLGFITKDRIAVGEMQYQTVIVPPVTSMRETTAKLLLAHCENGGRVIFLDGRPTMLDAQKDETGLLDALLRHPGSAFVHGYAALSGALSETVRPCVRLISQNGPDLWMNVRRTGDGYHVFLLNRGKKDESVSLGLSEICKAVCCNAERGTIEDVSCFRKDGMTAAEIVIPAGRSAMLAFIKSEEASCFVPMQSAQRMDISDGWTAGKQSAPNAFLLEYCSYRLNDDDEWSKEYPQIAIRRILKNSAYSGTLSLRYTFTVSEMPDSPVSLVLENAGDFRIALNGVRIDTQNTEGYYIDLSFTRVPLGHSLRIGTNELILTGEFRQPQTAVRSLFSLFQNEGGTELSDPYLIGDFGVSVCRTYSHTPLLRISPDYALVKKNAPSAEELVTSGYPFYAGSLTFTKTVDLGEFPEGAEWKFRIGDFRGCLAKISVNGSPEIPMIFSPYEADITPYLKPGRNELTLTYTNTLYNLLGPWHYPQGERSGTWQDSAWTGEERDAGDPDVWYIGKYADTSGYIGDYHLKSQGMSDITLEYELPL